MSDKELMKMLDDEINSCIENHYVEAADVNIALRDMILRLMKENDELRTHKCEYELTDQGCTVEDKNIPRIIELQKQLAVKDAEIAKHERCYHALEVHCKKLAEEYLRATNALKPVMECDPNEDINHTIYEWGLRNSNAVREAQRIMKEGDAK